MRRSFVGSEKSPPKNAPDARPENSTCTTPFSHVDDHHTPLSRQETVRCDMLCRWTRCGWCSLSPAALRCGTQPTGSNRTMRRRMGDGSCAPAATSRRVATPRAPTVRCGSSCWTTGECRCRSGGVGGATRMSGRSKPKPTGPHGGGRCTCYGSLRTAGCSE